mmetsp:Transcript_1793/g.2661  ORF Transcript_1793/g.2661 Transcript_1793/m.2661 type:complete len:805 (-) Transcript_1793:93-2507(-)
MGKTQTKRTRKFQAKGGIKGLLAKGHKFAKKGRVRSVHKQRASKSDHHDKSESKHDKSEVANEDIPSDDMLSGSENKLAGMEMDDFFNQFGDDDNENENINSAEEDQMKSGESSASSDDDDDDDDDSVGLSDDEMEGAEARHAEEMRKLREKDPEFYKYLKNNESSLLEFGQEEESDDDNDSDGVDEMDDGDDDDDVDDNDRDFADVAAAEKDESEPASSGKKQILLTGEVLEKYERSAFAGYGLKGLKNIVSAYRSACHLSDPNDTQKNSRFAIEESDVYDKLMVLCLGRCHDAFRYHLVGPGAKDGNDTNKSKTDAIAGEIDDNQPISPKVLVKARRWSEVSPILHVFLKSTLYLLSEAKEPELLTFILQSLAKFTPFITPFPRIAKALLKSLVSLWRAPFESQNDHVVRLQAFLRIRQLALTQPFPFIEDCLKSLYLAYAKSSKFVSEAALATLTFMGNCVVELYSLDLDSSYQHAFVYIRQLALHLRTAIQKKTKEAFQTIYSWQYLNCLKVWTAVLAANPGETELRSLVYPLTEIVLGVSRLLPTTRHLPIRLHCVRLLQQLAASSYTFIPTTSILLEVFDAKEIYMKPKKGGNNAQGVRLPLMIKLPKSDALRTMDQLEACISETFVLINREIDLYRYSAGFPEFTFRICQRLRKFCKETRVNRWKAYAKGCIDTCERHSAKAILDRSKLEEAPKDVKKLEILKPLDVSCMRERYEAAIAKERRLETATKPEFASSGEKGKKEEAASHVTKQKKTSKKTKTKWRRNKDDVEAKDIGEEALTKADEVAQGIDWSDDESK